MYLNKHLVYWIVRYSKTVNVTLDDLQTALRYKLPEMQFEGAEFAGGFEIFSPIEGMMYQHKDGVLRQHYFVITADSIKNALRVYIYKEELLTAEFSDIRANFCKIVEGIKEYLKEHKSVDKILGELIE